MKLLTLLFLVSRTCSVIQGQTDYDDDNENTIIEDIPNLLTSNSTIQIKENETLELYCQFNSELTDQIIVIWQFASQNVGSQSAQNPKTYSLGFHKIYNKRDFMVESLSEGKSGVKLIIPDVKISDSGDYRCSLNTPGGEMAVQKVIVQNPSASAIALNSSPALKSLFVPLLMITSALMIYMY